MSSNLKGSVHSVTIFVSSSHLALNLISIQEVDKNLQSSHISDSQLNGLLVQVKVPHGAQGDYCSSLVSTFEVFNKLL